MQVPRHWREIPERYRLEGVICRDCSKIMFPRRLVCPACASKNIEPHSLSGRGRLMTFTIIRVAPDGYGDQVPYAVGLVELDEGVRLMGQVVDCDPEALKIGDTLKTQFRRMREEGKTGMIMYSYKFVPDVAV